MAGGSEDERDMWGKQVQNFLICLEMLLFSIAHFFCFPTEEWQEGYRPAKEKQLRMMDNMALGDFMSDLRLIMRGSKNRKAEKKTEEVSEGAEAKHGEPVDDDEGGGTKEGQEELVSLIDNTRSSGKRSKRRRKGGRKKPSCVIS